ncbi:MAG: anthrone oxygenase family protein [Pseudonocardiales bacterium]
MSTARDVADPATHPRPAGSRSGAAGPVLGAATLAMGLMAGLFYAFAVSVMPGLARTDDQTFVTVLQKINEAIQNAAFTATFFGAFVFTGAAAILQHRLGARAAVRWILAALALYVVALAITMGVNVPLNDMLAAAGEPSRAVNLAEVRNDFEGLWTATNVARAVACTLALACLGRALTLHGRS